jgi:L-cysteine:1D-myo-inositol 2-amino-2-deoxy-alpha-D-glucopyranoside ligase
MDGEKMSKSLGNMVFARDLINRHGADAVRVYVSSNHYRSELHWNPEALLAAADRATWLRESLRVQGDGETGVSSEDFRDRFVERMNDDLDTPGALDVLDQLAASIREASARDQDVRPAQALLRELGNLLGLTFEERPATAAP